MPGDYQPSVHVYFCIEYPDGSWGYCQEVRYVKVPFTVAEGRSFGFRAPGEEGINIPIEDLVKALESYGMTVSIDTEKFDQAVYKQKLADDTVIE